MKATILSGLIAVALGGLTSCSNILEENGVINNVAESGMGELRINLTTDPTVEAITKASTPEDPSNFTVSIGETTYNYTQWYNQTLLVKTGSDQTITAYNLSTVDDFAWNKPYYKGENTNVDIVAGQIATVTIDCKRANSTLAIDTTGFNPELIREEKIYGLENAFEILFKSLNPQVIILTIGGNLSNGYVNNCLRIVRRPLQLDIF